MAIGLVRARLGEPGPPPYSLDDTRPAVEALIADYRRTYVDWDNMLKAGFENLVNALVIELSKATDTSPDEILSDVEAKWAT